MGFRKTIRESHKDYLVYVLADELTDALSKSPKEMKVLANTLYEDGLPDFQGDFLEENYPYLYAKYMEWHNAYLKEQIVYAKAIVRVQANTRRLIELTALFRQMNAQNA